MGKIKEWETRRITVKLSRKGHIFYFSFPKRTIYLDPFSDILKIEDRDGNVLVQKLDIRFSDEMYRLFVENYDLDTKKR